MMVPIRLSSLMQAFGGELVNVNNEAIINSVSINTREIKAGDLFVALKGERFDAHDFISEAEQKGAQALVVDRKITHSDLPQWIVDDTTQALGHIAQQQRGHFQGQLIAITGSSGKTTVKGMVEHILRAEVGDAVFATKGNLNNHIGVPLSLLSLNSQHQYAVIEMGASAVGDIAYLTQMASPHAAVVNNVMSAHIEGFGSIDNIAKGKGEIYDGLVDSGLTGKGVAIINAADKYADQWRAQNAHRSTLTFSANALDNADIFASNIEQSHNGCASFSAHINHQVVPVSLSVLGLHNVSNALAAAACAYAVGASVDAIKRGLSNFRGVVGRLYCVDGISQSTVIDDSYNANPDAFFASINVLADMSARTVLVMGDMGELGAASTSSHQKVGAYAAQKKIDCLLTVGAQSRLAHDAFSGNKQHFADMDALIDEAKSQADKQTVFLIKGSRSARMDRVVEALTLRGTSSC